MVFLKPAKALMLARVVVLSKTSFTRVFGHVLAVFAAGDLFEVLFSECGCDRGEYCNGG